MSVLLAVPIIGVLALLTWRLVDRRALWRVWRGLVARQPAAPARFDASMVAALPDPARRFFAFAIAPGTPLYTVAEIRMHGEFGLGSKEKPGYVPMRAEQVLAAPHGFLWHVRAGKRLRFSGSDAAADGYSWSRFWLAGIVPIARAGNTPDHLRSAFGRYVAEAVFWTPAALLPGDHVRWAPIDASTARVTLTHYGLEQAVDVTVDAEGRPSKVVFQRWSNANPERVFRLQPFGGYLADYRDFGGFQVPTRVEAANLFETDDHFTFFKARVTDVRFPSPNN